MDGKLNTDLQPDKLYASPLKQLSTDCAPVAGQSDKDSVPLSTVLVKAKPALPATTSLTAGDFTVWSKLQFSEPSAVT